MTLVVVLPQFKPCLLHRMWLFIRLRCRVCCLLPVSSHATLLPLRSRHVVVCYSQVPARSDTLLPQSQYHQRGGLGTAARLPQRVAASAFPSLAAACGHQVPAPSAVPPPTPPAPWWVIQLNILCALIKWLIFYKNICWSSLIMKCNDKFAAEIGLL